LLDPKVMAGCVPGVQSVEVLSDTEYLANIKVKISFISANFRIKTTILETRPPHYLRCEGTGEDSSVASSLKQTTEMFLAEVPGGTEIRTRTHAEVFGRLGSFGLSVMKTKADRMWEEFGANLAAILRQDVPNMTARAGESAATAAHKTFIEEDSASQTAAPQSASGADKKPNGSKWWSRLLGSGKLEGDNLCDLRLPSDIYLEVHRGRDVIKILWPAKESEEAARLLKEIIGD
jgi:carbon monoxide dehydrogenase subunit G